MRIALVVTEFPKITETFTLREVIELERRGNEVKIIYLTPFRHNEVVHDFARHLVPAAYGRPWLFGGGVLHSLSKFSFEQPAKVTRIVGRIISSYRSSPILLLKSLALIPKCLKIAEELIDWRADHVHASFAGHPATASWIINQAVGIPYSITCHAHDIFRSQLMLDVKFRNATFVRTISEYNARFLRDKLGEAACRKLHVIHCGIDTSTCARRISNEGDRRTPSARDLRILFVGSLKYEKGVHVLLDALRRLDPCPGWKCRIIGDGPMLKELKSHAHRNGLEDKVEFAGAISAEEVTMEYQGADVLVTPSISGPGGRAEGIPTVLMEALGQSLPVIASRQTGIPELVKDGETGQLFEPGDSYQLASCLKRVIADPASVVKMAEEGRELVEREFNLYRNVDHLSRLLACTSLAGCLGEVN